MVQKISSILPSSPRLTTVDLNSGQAARPGSPSFGRRMGESNLSKNSIVRSAHSALRKGEEMQGANIKEREHSSIVTNMADNFFKKKEQIAQEEMLVNDIMLDQLANAHLEELNSANDLSSGAGVESENLDVPEIGRYIDIEA